MREPCGMDQMSQTVEVFMSVRVEVVREGEEVRRRGSGFMPEKKMDGDPYGCSCRLNASEHKAERRIVGGDLRGKQSAKSQSIYAKLIVKRSLPRKPIRRRCGARRHWSKGREASAVTGR